MASYSPSQKITVGVLICFAVWTVYVTQFAPASWASVSLCVWTALFILKGWRQMGPWDQRIFLWGMFSLFSFLHFLISDASFNGWGDVYFFCSSEDDETTYCLPSLTKMSAFRWNLRGWRKAIALWNFFLSTAVGIQRFIIEIGLGGLLLGEDAIARESLLSVAWRLVPFWLNRWESSFGAECSSLIFELPHFAAELLIVLPLTQILTGRLRIVGHLHLHLAGRAPRGRQNIPGAPPVGVGVVREPDVDGQGDNEIEELVPNVLNATWEQDNEQRSLIPRLRANLKPMAMIAFVSWLAVINALVVPVLLEKQATSDPRATTVADFENELGVLVAAGKRADAMQHSMQRLHASSNPQSSPTLLSSTGGCMAKGNCTGPLHDRLARIIATRKDTKGLQRQIDETQSEWLVPTHWVIRLIEDLHYEQRKEENYGNIGLADAEIKETLHVSTIASPSSPKKASKVLNRIMNHLDKIFNALHLEKNATLRSTVEKSAEKLFSHANRMISMYHKMNFGMLNLVENRLRSRSSGPKAKSSANFGYGTDLKNKKNYTDINIDKMVVLLLSEETLSSESLMEGPDYNGLRKMQKRFWKVSRAKKVIKKASTGLNEQDSVLLNSTMSDVSDTVKEENENNKHSNQMESLSFLAMEENDSEPNLSILYRNLAKHADELRRMRDPEHRSLVPIVEAALTIMRLSCERWFALVGVYLGYLIFRDPPPYARSIIGFIAVLSRTFHRLIILSFPGVCWIYGAGFVFSSFASVVFWTAPVLRMIERLRGVASEVEPENWHPASPAEIERNGGNCPVCWSNLLHSGNHRTATTEGDPNHEDNIAENFDHQENQISNSGQGHPVRENANQDLRPRNGTIGKNVMALSCGHAYHRHCISQWLSSCHAQSRPSKCPMCLADVPLRIRWRLPAWRMTNPAELELSDDDSDDEQIMNRDRTVQNLQLNGFEGRINQEPARVWPGRERGIPGINALVNELRDEFRNRFELPMPHPIEEENHAVDESDNGDRDDDSSSGLSTEDSEHSEPLAEEDCDFDVVFDDSSDTNGADSSEEDSSEERCSNSYSFQQSKNLRSKCTTISTDSLDSGDASNRNASPSANSYSNFRNAPDTESTSSLNYSREKNSGSRNFRKYF